MYSEKLVQKPGEGTLVFSKLDESDAGTYQCQAINDNGTAVSYPTRLEQTCTFSLLFSDRFPLNSFTGSRFCALLLLVWFEE
ncbi:hypothetical protein COOONC_28420 [Cooperia oncophora]